MAAMGATDLICTTRSLFGWKDPTLGVNHHPLLWVSWEQDGMGDSPVSAWARGESIHFPNPSTVRSSGGLLPTTNTAFEQPQPVL